MYPRNKNNIRTKYIWRSTRMEVACMKAEKCTDAQFAYNLPIKQINCNNIREKNASSSNWSFVRCFEIEPLFHISYNVSYLALCMRGVFNF